MQNLTFGYAKILIGYVAHISVGLPQFNQRTVFPLSMGYQLMELIIVSSIAIYKMAKTVHIYLEQK